MFVTIQGLTNKIDNHLRWLQEARENKANFDTETFEKYEDDMSNLLNRCLERLKEESSNDKLIKKYARKVGKALRER